MRPAFHRSRQGESEPKPCNSGGFASLGCQARHWAQRLKQCAVGEAGQNRKRTKANGCSIPSDAFASRESTRRRRQAKSHLTSWTPSVSSELGRLEEYSNWMPSHLSKNVPCAPCVFLSPRQGPTTFVAFLFLGIRTLCDRVSQNSCDNKAKTEQTCAKDQKRLREGRKRLATSPSSAPKVSASDGKGGDKSKLRVAAPRVLLPLPTARVRRVSSDPMRATRRSRRARVWFDDSARRSWMRFF